MFITILFKGDDRSWFFLDSPQKVQKVAEMIRQEVFNYQQPFESWPPHPDEINHENVVFQLSYLNQLARIFSTMQLARN